MMMEEDSNDDDDEDEEEEEEDDDNGVYDYHSNEDSKYQYIDHDDDDDYGPFTHAIGHKAEAFNFCQGKLFNLYPDMKMFIQIFTSSLVDRYSLLVADEWMYLCSFRYLQFQHPLRRRGIEHLQDLEGYTHWRAPLTKLHPGKRTCPLKNSGWKTTFLLKWPLFSGHVSFQGCILKII